MAEQTIVDKVNEHLAHTGNSIQGIRLLSDNIIAVVDKYYDLGIFYDPGHYTLTNGVKSENCGSVNYLSPTSAFPKMKNYDEALNFAKENLIPKNKEEKFYDQPIKIK